MLEGTGVAPEGRGCPSLGRPGSAEGSDDRGLKVKNVQPLPASSCRCYIRKGAVRGVKTKCCMLMAAAGRLRPLCAVLGLTALPSTDWESGTVARLLRRDG